MNNKYNDIWDKRYYYVDEGGLLGTPRFFIYTPFGHWWRKLLSRKWRNTKFKENWGFMGMQVGMSRLISHRINQLRDRAYYGSVMVFKNDRKVAVFSRTTDKPTMGLFI